MVIRMFQRFHALRRHASTEEPVDSRSPPDSTFVSVKPATLAITAKQVRSCLFGSLVTTECRRCLDLWLYKCFFSIRVSSTKIKWRDYVCSHMYDIFNSDRQLAAITVTLHTNERMIIMLTGDFNAWFKKPVLEIPRSDYNYAHSNHSVRGVDEHNV